MKPSEALTKHRAELRQLIRRYKVMRPRVIGSVVTGADTEESDLRSARRPHGLHDVVYTGGVRA